MHHSNPKPTGEWTVFEMSSGEWCVEFDDSNGATCINELNAKAIANAHNAELDAEREEAAKWRSEASKTNELRQQLAVERDNYALALQMSRIEARRANEAEAQLAAEREKVRELFKEAFWAGVDAEGAPTGQASAVKEQEAWGAAMVKEDS